MIKSLTVTYDIKVFLKQKFEINPILLKAEEIVNCWLVMHSSYTFLSITVWNLLGMAQTLVHSYWDTVRKTYSFLYVYNYYLMNCENFQR